MVTGGQYDVDVIITDPKNNVLYKQVKKQYDSHEFKTEMKQIVAADDFRADNFLSTERFVTISLLVQSSYF